MRSVYRTRYRDLQGDIETTIENDGATLRMSLCGVDFEGNDFDSFEVVSSTAPADLSRFSFAGGTLCSCLFEFEIPVIVAVDAGELRGTLEARLRLGSAHATGGIDEESLHLVLVVGDLRLESEGRSGWFEDELLDLQRRLPSHWFLKTCFGCGLSDYSPVGHGLFGGLACFRDNKLGYRSVRTKDELFRIWDTMTAFVQETHLCPEFERRTPGAGYRG
ncbi:DUF6304 family protein [Chondromyces crocatus]|uniref:Uncharacterized protein n=1 Tax=Chondromyces crocatus TaxID=52 RepID=A0A0K1ELC5_CHOCO|nr:DUF6304 family protein [Chondromyces crocatus]AKT41601.1 uncharacterized protein CMC5_058080 [Chondromyces crocatus]